MRRLRRVTHDLLASVDALLTPTVSETFTVEEMLADDRAQHAPGSLRRSPTCSTSAPWRCRRGGSPGRADRRHRPARRRARRPPGVGGRGRGRRGHRRTRRSGHPRGRVPRHRRGGCSPGRHAAALLTCSPVGLRWSSGPRRRRPAVVPRFATPSPPSPLRRVAVGGAAIEVEVYRCRSLRWARSSPRSPRRWASGRWCSRTDRRYGFV